VTTVALLACGKALTVSRDEKAYRLWDPATGREQSRGATGEKMVAAALPAPGANLLAVGQYVQLPTALDNTIRLIDVVTGKVRHLEADTGMMPLAITPDGRTLAAAEGPRQVVVWDTAAAKVRRRIELDRDLNPYMYSPPAALSPDGRLLALRLIVRGARPGADRHGRSLYLGVWDVATGRQRWSAATTPFETDSLAFSPDGNLLAEGTVGRVQLWESETGRKRHTLACHVPGELTFAGDSGRLAFTPDGKTLIAGNGAAWVFLWDVEAGRERRRFAAHRGRVSGVSVSPDGTSFATASEDTTALIWELWRR
jgi:WD40 repeat protein